MGDGGEGSFGDGGEGSFGDGGEGSFGDGGERCMATVWGQAKIVDLRGGEWCIATRIHLSVAIQADVRGSKGKSKSDVSGAWQHGHRGGDATWQARTTATLEKCPDTCMHCDRACRHSIIYLSLITTLFTPTTGCRETHALNARRFFFAAFRACFFDDAHKTRLDTTRRRRAANAGMASILCSSSIFRLSRKKYKCSIHFPL